MPTALATNFLQSDLPSLASTTASKQFQTYVFFAHHPPPITDREKLLREADATVRVSAHFLELFWAAACAHEVLVELGTTDFATSNQPPQFFTDRVKQITGLDVVALVKDPQTVALLKQLPAPPAATVSLPDVMAAVRTVLAACPISRIEQHARTRGLEKWGHRCRVAYDGLEALVLRNDPQERDRVGIIGKQFASGALSIREVATLLRVHVVDAVALLESHGYTRSKEQLALPDAARATFYSAMREDRVRRGGKFEPSSEQIARDVVASERIEGVDVRSWIKA